jgi:hypothetical protein
MSDSRIILPFGNGSNEDESCGGCGQCGGCGNPQTQSVQGNEESMFAPGTVVMSKLTGQKLMVLESGQNKMGSMMYVVRSYDYQAHQLFDFEVEALEEEQEIDDKDMP